MVPWRTIGPALEDYWLNGPFQPRAECCAGDVVRRPGYSILSAFPTQHATWLLRASLLELLALDRSVLLQDLQACALYLDLQLLC